MRRAGLGAVFKWRGELVEVTAISDQKTLILQPIGKEPCSLCGSRGRYHVVEDSRLFQAGAEPVPGLEAA